MVTKLYADIEMLNQELTRTRALEECVNNLTDELNKARDRDVKKDLLVQEAQFKVQDVNRQIK